MAKEFQYRTVAEIREAAEEGNPKAQQYLAELGLLAPAEELQAE